LAGGLEVLRWSKAARPEGKVIIVTVHTEDAYRQAAEVSGADAFLLKRTLGTDLVPTLQRLRGALALPQASHDSAPPGHGRCPCRETS
jgi:DNA-binding NarL/FixJ family response regulator